VAKLTFWESWKQTIVLGLVLAAMQLMVATLLVIHVDKRLDAATIAPNGGARPSAGAPPAGGPGVGAPKANGGDGSMSPRVYDPDDAPPTDVPSSVFDEELRAWLASVVKAEGGNLDAMDDPEQMYREREKLQVLLPPSEVTKLLAYEDPAYIEAVGDDYVRGMLLMHVLAQLRQNTDDAKVPNAQGSHAMARPMDPSDQLGQVTPGDVSTLDQLLSERLERQAQAAGVDPATMMPSDEMREAAKATGELDSDATRALLEAYTEAFDTLRQ
jgi:hypothetical protein